MGAFIVYIIKSSLLLAMFVSLFMLFMSRETFHKLNRYLLLFIIVVSLALPFANVGVSTPLQGFFDFIENGGRVTEEVVPVADELLVDDFFADGSLPLLEMSEQPVVMDDAVADVASVSVPVEEQGSAGLSWLSVVFAIYGLGVTLLVVRLLVMYVQLSRIIMRSSKVSAEQYGLRNVKLRLHSGEEKPFSWFGWVVVSNKDMDEGAREILTHEAAHVRAGHSWDILLADAVIMLQWFNPLAWIMKNTLKDIHEFEADEAVISSGVNAKQYQLLIIKKAVGARLYSIANSFNHSLTKKRITMMCKEKSSKWSCAKALYILPVAAIAALSFSTVENANAEPVGKVNEFVADGTISGVENNTQVVEVDSICEIAQAPANDDPEKVFQVVEVQPEFPGGMKEMMKYLQSNLKYPEAAKAAGAEGKAFVQFVVKADGSISDVQIMRSTGNESLDAEALRVVKAMPKWRPAMNKGKAVNVKFVLPIVYKLPKEANGNGVYMSEGNKEKLLVVSGGAVYDGDINDIDPLTIESIEIVKLPDLTPELQEKLKQTGKEAVMYINFKKEASGNGVYMSEGNKEKLLVVSGGAIYDGDINDIDPLTIESIEIVKFPDLTPELQEKLKQTGKEAVMYINFKKEKSVSAVGNEAVFTVCEKMTEFLGGQQEMMKFLSANIKYPIEARNAQLQGKIYVQFVVNKEGDIVDAKIAKGSYSFSDKLLNGATAELETLFGEGSSVEKIDDVVVVAYANGEKQSIDTSAPDKHPAAKYLAAEAVRVVSVMPKWIPGMQDGKPVNVQFMLPIMFKLQ